MRNQQKSLRTRLYEYYVAAAEMVVALSDEEKRDLEVWREANPRKSDVDWPVIEARLGRKPGSGPELVTPIRRTA